MMQTQWKHQLLCLHKGEMLVNTVRISHSWSKMLIDIKMWVLTPSLVDVYKEVVSNDDKYKDVGVNVDIYKDVGGNDDIYKDVGGNVDIYKDVGGNVDIYV